MLKATENLEIQSILETSEITLDKYFTFTTPEVLYEMYAITIPSHKSQSFSELYGIAYAF